MTNDEARMTNETTMTNDKKAPRCTSFFVIVFSSFIRHSDFVIRHFVDWLAAALAPRVWQRGGTYARNLADR
jgi:hypothetical protein